MQKEKPLVHVIRGSCNVSWNVRLTHMEGLVELTATTQCRLNMWLERFKGNSYFSQYGYISLVNDLRNMYLR